MSITTTLPKPDTQMSALDAVLGDRLAAIISLHDNKQHAGRIPDGTLAKLRNSTFFRVSGGAYRDRTDDLMLAKHALSQLS